MKKEGKFILDIVPLTRIPLSRNQSFSYLSDKKLGTGTHVVIPLFERKIEGIVLKSRPDFPRLGNIELKNVSSVIEESFLDDQQLKLAEFTSDYYIAPLGIVLKSFVPKRVKARKKAEPESISQKISKKIEMTKEQKYAVNAINQKGSQFYLLGPAGSGKTEVYINAILKLKERNPELQFLILLPELTLTLQAIERYGEHFRPEEVAILNSKISKGEFYVSWNKIKSGEAKIIIGSRMAVFAPFKKLGLIIVDEEQDMSFKQWDMNPRYDARTVAVKLADLHGAKIVLGSATPSIESFHRAADNEYRLLKLPFLQIPGKTKPYLPEVFLVDLRKEHWIKNFSPISKKLQSEINYALKNKLQAILFVNRQGMSNFSVCTACKNVLKCPKCDRSLIYDAEGFYRCLHCSYKTTITPQCAKCKGLSFSNVGVGTQKVEREISEMFPQARTIRADGQTMKNPGSQTKLYRDFSQKKADILIGTQIISKGWDLPSVSLIGIIDADNMLSIPDFNANTKAYQNIVQVSGRAGRPGALFRGSVVIQTFDPEHLVIKAAVERDFFKLYEKEIKERKELQLPPFGKIVKLIFQDHNPKKVDTETRKAFLAFSKKKDRYTKIYEPHAPFLSRIRGRFRKQIIINFIEKNPEITGEARKILNSLPAGWIIDVDPISIV
jgi:primosomal protein N' (replication factor Y) (superfamily II helicase)